jgi:hypothetical protein
VEEIEISESMMREPRPLDTPELARAKGNLMLNLIDMFGDEKKKEMFKFIDDKYEGKTDEDMITLWL